MREIVINAGYGGFSLSYNGVMRYAELVGMKLFAHVPDFTEGKIKYKEYREGERESAFIGYTTKKIDLNSDDVNKYYFSTRDIERTDENLIKVVKELGEKANGQCATLKVIEIPNDIDWEIDEYDGFEHIAEKHKTWG